MNVRIAAELTPISALWLPSTPTDFGSYTDNIHSIRLATLPSEAHFTFMRVDWQYWRNAPESKENSGARTTICTRTHGKREHGWMPRRWRRPWESMEFGYRHVPLPSGQSGWQLILQQAGS